MNSSRIVILGVGLLAATPVWAQPAEPGGLGEILITTNRGAIRFAQADRPVIGLRRQADAAVMQVVISSDSRDAAVRKQEIYAVLASALDRAAAAGLDLVSGQAQLSPVTKANYRELTLEWGGRTDTSRVDLLVRAKLAGSVAATEKKLVEFIKALPGSGRGVVDRTGTLNLTIVDPDQYRSQIIRLVAEDVRATAALFGPDFAFSLTGIDGQVLWSQTGRSEVFLYLPYRYTIVPKK
jgi:hypothetical protein